jgi:hypothetical protein
MICQSPTDKRQSHIPNHLQSSAVVALVEIEATASIAEESFSSSCLHSSWCCYYCCCGRLKSRALSSEIAVTGTFGLAAISDFISALTSNMIDDQISNWTAIGAVHLYLLHAIIVLVLVGKAPSAHTTSTATIMTSTPATPTMERKNSTTVKKINDASYTTSISSGYFGSKTSSQMDHTALLEHLGDVLFLVGSIIDVLLSYFYNDRISNHVWKLVDRGNLVSAVLWLVDSILYISADHFSSDEADEDYAIVVGDGVVNGIVVELNCQEVIFDDETRRMGN